MSNIYKTQIGLSNRMIDNGSWQELLPPTDEDVWEFVAPNPIGGFVWKRRIDTGKPVMCIKCKTQVAIDNCNYCQQHFPHSR